MSTFSIEWKVSGVSHTRDFATRRNIKKAVLFPRYQGSVGSFEAVLGYVGSTEVAPTSNLNIIRTEDSLSENSRTAFSGERVWKGNTGYTSARYFLLTDIIGDYISEKPEPFYWKHILPDSSIDPNSIAILDGDLVEVDSNSYYAEQVAARDSSDNIISGSYESCTIYSNYRNSYDSETGNVELYFVRYSVSGTTHYQILNAEPAFGEAEVDDVSLVTGQIKPWRKVFISTAGSSLFTVKTPSSTTTYYLTPLEKSRIMVREPVDRSDESPWFVNISNGSFAIIRNSVTYVYSIAEFSSQTFSPISPYKLEANEAAEYLRSDIIKVDRAPLKVDDSLYKMEILIKNVQEQTLYALTTDTSRDGTFYEENGERVFRTLETDNAWITWDANGIAGWDAEGGFIHFQSEYPDTYYFYVTYYYEETGFEYTSLNVNPIFDEEYNDPFYALYIAPVGGFTSSQTVSIHYLKVDRSGRIIEASQDGTGGNWNLATTINDETQYMYYSLSGSAVSAVDQIAGQNYIEVESYEDWPETGIVTWVPEATGTRVYKAYNQLVNNRIYFENYTLPTTDGSGIEYRVHSFVDPYTSANEANLYQYLVLAEIHATSTSRVDELSIIDLRTPGGVIKDKYKEDALKIDSRSVWARPNIIRGRGQPIPGDSVAVVKVPYTLLQEYGGNFTKEQVEAIVIERHLATGVIPVVIFDGAIPNITSLASTTSSIVVSWDSEGDDYSYRIYYSSSSDGPWTLANSVLFSDYLYGNSYTISGLTSGLTYYVTISAVSSEGVEGPKSVAWGIKTRV
jgi:hypothetical protein